MRADRLISILLLLQVNRRLTARELADRLEVSERTILRDMEALSASGIPVVAERGAGGGWSLPEGYRVDTKEIKPAEAQSLFVARPGRVMQDLDLQREAEASLAKLLGSLSDARRPDGQLPRDRVLVDLEGWSEPSEAVPCLPVLLEAVWACRKVRFSYDLPESAATQHNVHALGLVTRGSMWYLIGRTDSETRAYRVSQITQVVVANEPAVVPDEFDLTAFWHQYMAEFANDVLPYEATLRANGPLIASVRRTGLQVMQDGTGDSSSEIRLRFGSEEEAFDFALRHGTDVEVLQPAELASRVADTAAAIFRRRCMTAP